MVIVVPLGLAANISYDNPLLAQGGPRKTVKNGRNPYEKGRKIDFLILGRVGMVGPGPYYRVIYTYICPNYHPNISPQLLYLGLIDLEIYFFGPQ
jgi:hypothetical protein